jgi:hypothetical protein
LEKVVTVSSYRPRKKPRVWLGADDEVLLTSVAASTFVKKSKQEFKESVW